MRYSVQQLDPLIDLMVERLLHDMENDQKNADAPGQGQRRQIDTDNANLQQKDQSAEEDAA